MVMLERNELNGQWRKSSAKEHHQRWDFPAKVFASGSRRRVSKVKEFLFPVRKKGTGTRLPLFYSLFLEDRKDETFRGLDSCLSCHNLSSFTLFAQMGWRGRSLARKLFLERGLLFPVEKSHVHLINRPWAREREKYPNCVFQVFCDKAPWMCCQKKRTAAVKWNRTFVMTRGRALDEIWFEGSAAKSLNLLGE